ncbi:MAG: glycerol-3-phosphate dehydrogenase [Oceanospirillaceae bacterium]|jgi:glycerol-3-phosphate dehydrogenase
MKTASNARQQTQSVDLSNEHYDVIVIGAGVVGCAMTRRFALQGAKVLLVEKSADILEGASKGNSAILHTGFDEVANSIEHQCVTTGYQEFLEIREQLNLPLLRTGAMVVAWNNEQAATLDGLMQKSINNGVTDIERLSTKQIAAKEPNLASSYTGALFVSGEHVIDPWTTPYSYLLQAIEHGACISRNTDLLSGAFEGNHWQLITSKGTFSANTVINCGGLYGDSIDAALIKKSPFEIKPRKGQFLVYDKAASKFLKTIILPVPTKVTKGVVVCRTIFGNLLVGPTAEEQQSRDDSCVDRVSLNKLRIKGEEILPALANIPITATYAGIRPATQFQDYCIQPFAAQNYISVGGIRSTGLSGALGIAKYVFELYSDMGNKHEAAEHYIWPKVNQIAEAGIRDWQKADNGGIICHCELVTRREIEQALTGPLAAASLNALKRRTRVTMGRCQGFYCTANLSEMTAKHFSQAINVNLLQDNKEVLNNA